MADAFTTTGSLSFDQTMWDRGAYYALRPMLYFDRFADVKSTNATPEQGATLTFTTVSDLAAATASLNESVDVDAVAMSDSQVSLTLEEKGNVVKSTFRVRATGFVPVAPKIANAVGFNAGLSIDTLAREVMSAGTNVRYAGQATSRATVIPTDTLKAANVRRALAELEGANVMPFGGYYTAVVHPDQKYDLRAETGAAAWRDPHTYSQPGEIWNGEIGEFEGFRFVSSPRAFVAADAGSSTTLTDVYRALFFGREAMAKAYSTYEGRGALPITIMGPVTDSLKRIQPVGWHWFGKFGIFRQAALRAVETASSIGTNA